MTVCVESEEESGSPITFKVHLVTSSHSGVLGRKIRDNFLEMQTRKNYRRDLYKIWTKENSSATICFFRTVERCM